MLYRQLGLAEEDSDPSAQMPRRRQIGIERQGPIDQDGAGIELPGDPCKGAR
jgi:hypothetical protein